MIKGTVLITGTTSGIGYSFSKKFAKKGYNIVLVARNKNKLMAQQKELETYGIKVHCITQDFQLPEAASNIRDALNKKNLQVDILVNNAGFNESGYFISTDLRKEKDMIQLHTVFLVELTKLLLPSMIKNGYGRVLNVGSTGSYIPCPLDAVYAATKAFVLSYTNALSTELKGTGVKVTTLCPGSTKTEFAKKASLEETMLFKMFVMEPDKVVEIAFKKLLRGKRVVIPGLYNKLLVLSSKIMPPKMIGHITLKMLHQ